MARYAVDIRRTAHATNAVGSLTADATTPRRMSIYEWMMGSEDTPADNAFSWEMQRCTTAGTSTAVTPQALDPAEAAALNDAGENHSSNPTLTSGAFMGAIPLNQRATFRWVASPGGEIVTPATASNGVAIITPTSSAVDVISTLHFIEH